MRRTRAIGTVVALAIAVSVRGWILWGLPHRWHHDAGLYAVHAWRLLHGKYQSLLEGGYAQIPLLGHSWTALWAVLVGTRSLPAIQMPGIAGSLVAIAAAGVIAQRLAPQRPFAPIVTMLLLGMNAVFAAFSTMSAYMDPVLFQALAVAALLLAERHAAWVVVTALAGALSTLAYYSGRWTPVVLALVGIVRVAQGHLSWRRLACAGALTLALLGPQAWAATQPNPSVPHGRLWEPNGRMDMFCTVYTATHGPSDHCPPLMTRIERTLGVFTPSAHDGSTQFGVPGVPLLSAMEVIAVLVGLVAFGGSAEMLLLAWAGSILFVGGALTLNCPFYPRILPAVVPLCIMLGLLCGKAIHERRIVGGAVVLAVIAGAAASHLSVLPRWTAGSTAAWILRVGEDILALPPQRAIAFDAPHRELSCDHPFLLNFIQDRPCRRSTPGVLYRVREATTAPECPTLAFVWNYRVERCE